MNQPMNDRDRREGPSPRAGWRGMARRMTGMLALLGLLLTGQPAHAGVTGTVEPTPNPVCAGQFFDLFTRLTVEPAVFELTIAYQYSDDGTHWEALGTDGEIRGTPITSTTYRRAFRAELAHNGRRFRVLFQGVVAAVSGPLTVIADSTGPTFGSTPNLSATAAPGQCTASVSFAPTATDTCSTPTVICKVGDATITSPRAFPVGTTTVNCTATDAAGNTSTTSFTLTVADNEKPSFGAPTNRNATTDPGQCTASVSFSSPSATDNCGTPTVVCKVGDTTITSPHAFPIGTTTVACTATDAVGNTATTSFTVTVTDVERPSFGGSTNRSTFTDTGKCTALMSFLPPMASDNCGTPTVICKVGGTTITSPHAFPLGETTVNCTATDAAGNTATTRFTVTVTDTEKPTITCPPPVSVTTDTGQCSASGVALGTATTDDNCVASTTNDAPTTFPLGDTTVTWTATDAAGNTATGTQMVTVTAPALRLTCGLGSASGGASAGKAIVADPGQCSASLNVPTASSIGGCGTVTVVGVRADGEPLDAPYPVGSTTITWTATDGAGSTATCTQTIAVHDVEEPTITCPLGKIVSINAPGCSASVPVDQPTATDNCEDVTINGSRSDGKPLTDPYPLGTTTITWTATDAAGNEATCTQSVTVKDTAGPTISGLAATPNRIWSPNHKLVEVTVSYTGSDNCTSAITWALSATSSEPDSGLDREDVPGDIQIVDARRVWLRAERYGKKGRVYTLTLTGTDAAGNRTQKTVTVTVPH